MTAPFVGLLSMAALVALLAQPAPTMGQVTQEHIVALAESVGFQIDASERERYGLFPAHQGFLQAEFVQRDDGCWLRLTYSSGGRRLVEQSSVTEAQLLAWRNQILAIDQGRLSGRVGALSHAAGRDGRLRLVTDAFLYGLWLYGPATIALFDVDGSQGATAIELLAGGGAFTTALIKTRDYRLGYARTTLIRWGNYTGTFYGLGLPALLHADSDKAFALGAMAATPVGGWLAWRWSGQRPFGKGEADLISTGTWVGALYGLALPYLAGADDAPWRLYLASSMAGAPAGALLTKALVEDRTVNRGRAHLLMLGGFMGSAQALSLVDLLDPDAPGRAYAWGAALGAPVGAWAGYRLTEDRRHTLGRARMISVGFIAGGLGGQGIVLSLGLGGRLRTAAGMAGSSLGVWFTDRLTENWGQDVTRHQNRTTGLLVELPSPASLLMLGAAASGTVSASLPPLPLLHISF